MGRQYELIVFDWDGTLMDSTGAIVASIKAAAADLGIEPPPEARARHIIGLGLIDALRHALPDLPKERYQDVAQRYRHHYLSRDQDLLLFEGVENLLADLAEAGHMLAVATGKTRVGLNRAFEVSGIGSRFHGSRCADECRSKPDPQMLEELMDEFGVTAEETLMIGDTTHDLLMARNAGVAALAVTYGAHGREVLAAEAPLFCADSVADLADWLRQGPV
jgi:phosphoglycolate phosphatase